MTGFDMRARRVADDRLSMPQSRVAVFVLVPLFAAVVVLAGCGSSDEPSVEDLYGTWSASFGPTWEIDADGIAVAGGAVSEISYIVTDTTTIRVSDGSGCPTGTYDWVIEEDVLTLSVVGDDCDGRREAWDGAQFTREESE